MKRFATEHSSSSSSSSSYHYRRTDGTLASLPFATKRTPPPPTAGGGAEEEEEEEEEEDTTSSRSTLTTLKVLGKERTKTKLWKLVLLALLLVGFSRASSSSSSFNKTTSPKRARIVSSSSSSSSFSNRLEGSFASRKESLERHHHQRNIDPAFGGGVLGEEGPRHVDWKALGRDFREKRRQTDAANAWNGKPQKYGILARRGGERQHAE